MSDRRTYLRRLGTGIGVAFLAGCVDENAGGGDEDSTEQESDQPGETESPADSSDDVTTYAPPREVHETLSENGVPNYEGEMVDRTGESESSVAVGAGDSGLTFDPPAVRVDPGTELTWEWTGNGGAHNVVGTDPEEALDSGEPRQEPETTYTVVFETDGNYIYNCQPHAALGMSGAVVVGNGGSGDPDAVVELDRPGGENPGGNDDSNGQPAARADQYLEQHDANLYRGEIVDGTGYDTIEIGVGVGDGFGFEPPAVRVDPGTEVVWVWSGNGGAHNVVSADESVSDFRSGEVVSEGGVTFSQTLETPGAHLYYCTPHLAVGMCGAIVVEE